jgi:hypothetical protein
MKFSVASSILGGSLIAISSASAAFYGDPPDSTHPWAVHDMNRPQPAVVTPGTFSTPEKAGQPPSDAIVLFDGKDLSKWISAKNGGKAEWIVKDGYTEVTPSKGDIQTREEFGDCQLHVEWASPTVVKGSGQGRGNSGIFLMGLCEIQVLDCYNNPTYADGTASSIYCVNPPMVNPLQPPGVFQVYDIVFRRPVFKNGKMLDPGRVTVFVNGVLTQDATPLEGPTGHMRRTAHAPYPEKGPLKLQDHGDLVKFRNIWYRPLPPRPIEGGLDGGFLTEAATMAKRQETAAKLRGEAEKMDSKTQSLNRMLRLMESLGYEKDNKAVAEIEKLAADYSASLKALSPEQLAAKKDEVRSVNGAIQYSVRFGLMSGNLPLKAELEKMIRDNKWDK